jgi:biopolymer transport protein TolR
MGARVGTKGVMADINLTPLIDIVLVVLIIMMVNIPIQVRMMGVKLPNMEVRPPDFEVPPDQLVIQVYTDGKIALNRRIIAEYNSDGTTIQNEDKLFYEVTRRLRPMDKKNVFIDAHGDVDYGKVIDMIDLSRAAGASNVGLAKMKPEGPQPPTSAAPGSMPQGVSLGNPNPVGFMTGKVAEAAILPLMSSIEACYSAALARNPQTTGRLTGVVEVEPSGRLRSYEISSSNVGDPQLELCVKEQLGRLKFESLGGPDKTAAVVYPLLFSPG